MATKSKSKAKAKRAPRKRAKPKPVPTVVANHRFAPGTEVGFYPLAMVGVERASGREPFPSPIKTAKVDKKGVLKVSGLGNGMWVAAGEVGDRYRYFQFSKKGQ